MVHNPMIRIQKNSFTFSMVLLFIFFIILVLKVFFLQQTQKGRDEIKFE